MMLEGVWLGGRDGGEGRGEEWRERKREREESE